MSEGERKEDPRGHCSRFHPQQGTRGRQEAFHYKINRIYAVSGAFSGGNFAPLAMVMFKF
jgi:hypothetical protein